MTLRADKRLGPYEILSPLGAGGMGEVWRARDTGLDREVAIKVLPASFAHDEEAVRAFFSNTPVHRRDTENQPSLLELQFS